MWTLILTRRARRDLDALPADAYRAVAQALEELAADPFAAGLRKMRGLPVRWRVRVGDYRVITQLDTRGRTITVLTVGNRRDVYR